MTGLLEVLAHIKISVIGRYMAYFVCYMEKRISFLKKRNLQTGKTELMANSKIIVSLKVRRGLIMKLVKRWLSAGILVFTFFVMGVTISPSVSSAEDIWFYSQSNWSYYLISETIKDRGNKHPQYTVQVKKVIGGKYMGDFELLGFAYENGTLISYVFHRYNMRWEYPGRVSEDPYTSAAWRAMQPYL